MVNRLVQRTTVCFPPSALPGFQTWSRNCQPLWSQSGHSELGSVGCPALHNNFPPCRSIWPERRISVCQLMFKATTASMHVNHTQLQMFAINWHLNIWPSIRNMDYQHKDQMGTGIWKLYWEKSDLSHVLIGSLSLDQHNYNYVHLEDTKRFLFFPLLLVPHLKKLVHFPEHGLHDFSSLNAVMKTTMYAIVYAIINHAPQR